MDFSLDDVNTLEGDEYATPLDVALSLQRAINSGLWSLQGSYGRSMMQAITRGDCALGPKPAKDFWGNYIPSRNDVQPGTKGSLDFVERAHDLDWRNAIESA